MIADIALHIALIVNIEERKTGVVLVLRTDSTIKWTTSKNWCECSFWEIRLLEVIVALLVVFEICRNHRIRFSTFWTKLPEKYRVIFCYNVCRNESFLVVTEMTKRLSCTEEKVVVWGVEGHISLINYFCEI